MMTDPFEQLGGLDRPERPNPDFAARLGRRIDAIERRQEQRHETEMESDVNTTNEAKRDQLDEPAKDPAIPGSSKPIVPYLSVTDSRAALAFYTEVFGAVQYGELFEMGDGRIGHAMMTIGDQLVYLADEFPEMNILGPTSRGGGTVALVIQVEDCDETYRHAIDAGATEERPPSNQHGGRSGWFVDPWGHRWSPTSEVKPDLD